LHHKVQKFPSGTGSPGWSRKKGRKMVVVVLVVTVWFLSVQFYFWHCSINGWDSDAAWRYSSKL